MNGMTRHIACAVCRERKVRCNGEQPECGRCRQIGETCVYLPTQKLSKADLAQTVETLQQRLAKAEGYIRQMDNQENSGALSYFSDPNMNFEYTSMPLDMPVIPPPADRSFVLDQTSISPSWNPSSQANFPELLPSDHFYPPIMNKSQMINKRTYGQSQMEDADLSGDSRRQPNFPTLREIREQNSSQIPSSANSSDMIVDQNESLGVLSTELVNFSQVIFNTQADIAGLSLVVAQYLEWMRKTLKPGDNATLLETLEDRVREIHELAETRHWVAWKNIATPLKRLDRLGPEVSSFEKRVCRRSTEFEKFFQSKYDVRVPLSEQRESPVARAGSSSLKDPLTSNV